jgi:hypothetical protein
MTGLFPAGPVSGVHGAASRGFGASADGWARPETYETKRDAEVFLAQIQADQTRGDWIDPTADEVLFGEYSTLGCRQSAAPGENATSEAQPSGDALLCWDAAPSP